MAKKACIEKDHKFVATTSDRYKKCEKCGMIRLVVGDDLQDVKIDRARGVTWHVKKVVVEGDAAWFTKNPLDVVDGKVSLAQYWS